MTVSSQQIAFVFPGQGSQSIGMLQDLAQHHPEVEETFHTASEVLGRDLWAIASEGPDELINQTVNTQPLMLVAGIAVWRVWCKLSHVRPAFMAGHSLGEYTALVCSGALEFTDVLNLVQARAEAMQNAVPEGHGAMAAILGLDDEVLAALCSEQSGIVAPVNFNAPGQTVVAGEKNAVEAVLVAAKNAGAKRALLLPVSVPSHCELMKPAAEKLAEVLASVSIATPSTPVIHNFDVEQHESADEIKQVLTRQLFEPVRWIETVEKMAESGVTHIFEMGNGKVLAGLIKRIDRNLNVISVYDDSTLKQALEIFE